MLSGTRIYMRNHFVVELETFCQSSTGYLSWEHITTPLKGTLKNLL